MSYMKKQSLEIILRKSDFYNIFMYLNDNEYGVEIWR